MKLIKLIGNEYRNFKTWIYNRRVNKIIKEIKEKETIKVIFFIYSVSMWKGHGLYQELRQNKRFKPVVIPFYIPNDSKEIQRNNRKQILQLCRERNYEVHEEYNIENGEYTPAEELNGDIIIYTQPYDVGYPGWKIRNFWNHSLFLYIPYGISIEKLSTFSNTLLQQICLKVFISNNYAKNRFKFNWAYKGDNLEIVGDTTYDRLYEETKETSLWPIDKRKRIIWAPHHSIGDKEEIVISSFLCIYRIMLEIATQYSNRVVFAFKPHPALYRKLIKIWGESKTNQYYGEWNRGNRILCTQNYESLFIDSDALIHDSSSFTGEYLYTMKPVMYISKPGREDLFSEFGKLCYNLHEHGFTKEEICKFIDDVLNDIDNKKQEKELFYITYLLPPNNKSVGKNMAESLIKALK